MCFTGTITPCCSAYGLTTDGCNNVWLSANLDNVEGIVLDNANTLHAPAGSNDPMFFVGYSATGGLVDGIALPSGAGNSTGLANTGLSVDTSGNIYVSGDYRLFNPFVIGNDSLYIHNGANATIFVAKYHPNTICDTPIAPPPVSPDVPIITISPNPASNECVLDYNGSLGTGAANVSIRDIAGKLIATYPITGRKTILPISYLPQGVYVCMVKVEARPIYTLLLVLVK